MNRASIQGARLVGSLPWQRPMDVGQTEPAVNVADAVELCSCGEPATHFDDERGVHRCADCGPTRVPCSGCGRPTTWDDTYEDLCGACAFADNH